MLVDAGADVNARDIFEDTPLREALATGRLRCACFLVEKGADVNTHRLDGETCLHMTATRGYSRLTRYLLKRGANVNAVNKENETPLMCAVQNRRLLCVDVLLKYRDIDLYVPDTHGWTVLELVRVGRDRGDIRKSIMAHLKQSFLWDAQNSLSTTTGTHLSDSSSSSSICSDEDGEQDIGDVFGSPVALFTP